MTVDDQLSRKWTSVNLGLLVLLSNSASAYATTSSYLHRNLNATIEQTQMNGLLEDAIDADVIPTLALTLSYYDTAEWREIAAYYDDDYPFIKVWGILRSTSGIISFISSSIFIWMIMRSHDRLSTTQHRLLLGLCISDILSSLSQSTFNMHLPPDYYFWNARGNQATNNARGFLLTLGIFGGLYYNASLNLYFLAVVKYNKSKEFIRAKMEPFLHGVPIAVALCYSIYRLVTRLINDYNVGNDIFWAPFDLAHICLLFIPVVIMIVSLGMIYCAVRTQEKKLAKYGVGALRSNLLQQSASTPQQRTVQDEQSSGMWGRMTMSLSALSTSLKSRTWSCRKTNKPVARSNNVQSQSRAVMYKAFGYTFAWFLSYGLFVIVFMVEIYMGGYIGWYLFPLVLFFITYICMPLQGLFNLLIFMHPKIVAAKKPKKRGETVSWCEALSTAFWSKGKKRNNQGTSRSNLRGRSSNRPLRNKRNENAVCGGVETPMFGRIKKKKTKKRRERAHQEEEEKCEIQVPDNLNPNMTRAMYSAASPAIYERNNVPPPSTEITTVGTLNLSVDDDMVGMEKADFVENVNGGNALSDIVEDPYEDSMASQDEEEEMNDVEKGSNEIMPMVVADVNKQKEISMEHEDEGKEMSADDQA